MSFRTPETIFNHLKSLSVLNASPATHFNMLEKYSIDVFELDILRASEGVMCYHTIVASRVVVTGHLQ
jgi:hypothetical protein